jgi:hypothetical protein
MFEEILAVRQRVLGSDHPISLITRSNIGKTHLVAGRIDQAITVFEKVLAEEYRILGPEHPETLFTRHNLTMAHILFGHLDHVHAMADLVATMRRVLGHNHPETMIARRNTVRILRAAAGLPDGSSGADT